MANNELADNEAEAYMELELNVWDQIAKSGLDKFVSYDENGQTLLSPELDQEAHSMPNNTSWLDEVPFLLAIRDYTDKHGEKKLDQDILEHPEAPPKALTKIITKYAEELNKHGVQRLYVDSSKK